MVAEPKLRQVRISEEPLEQRKELPLLVPDMRLLYLTELAHQREGRPVAAAEGRAEVARKRVQPLVLEQGTGDRVTRLVEAAYEREQGLFLLAEWRTISAP